jgi:polyketide synthase PksL
MTHRRLPTRNRTGWTSNVLNELSELFVAFAAQTQRPVLDIGAAYGVASLPALAAGATVYANDADPSHLATLAAAPPPPPRAPPPPPPPPASPPPAPPPPHLATLAAATPPAHLPRLHLLPGRFPHELPLPPASLDAVHASNVLHFLPGDELTHGLALVHRWLAPGGRLFIQAATPYQQPFQAFVPTFEARLAAGYPWPGWVPAVRAISQHKKLGQIPAALHLLDEQTLSRLVLAHGFTIERCWTYRRRDLPRSMHLDGREGVGLVATSL